MLHARREWQDILQSNALPLMARYTESPERKDLQPRILYPARLSFKIEGEIQFLRHVKGKTIEQYQTCSEGNIERSSLNRKEARIYRKEQITGGNKLNESVTDFFFAEFHGFINTNTMCT